MWEMPKFAPDKHFPLRGICRISSAYHSFSRLVASCTNLFLWYAGKEECLTSRPGILLKINLYNNTRMLMDSRHEPL